MQSENLCLHPPSRVTWQDITDVVCSTDFVDDMFLLIPSHCLSSFLQYLKSSDFSFGGLRACENWATSGCPLVCGDHLLQAGEHLK